LVWRTPDTEKLNRASASAALKSAVEAHVALSEAKAILQIDTGLL
jgi:hypothetical protein